MSAELSHLPQDLINDALDWCRDRGFDFFVLRASDHFVERVRINSLIIFLRDIDHSVNMVSELTGRSPEYVKAVYGDKRKHDFPIKTRNYGV